MRWGATQRKRVWDFCIDTWVCVGILHWDDKDWEKWVGQDNIEMSKWDLKADFNSKLYTYIVLREEGSLVG